MRIGVVGAGPGGATAALLLARAGGDVVLYERDAWPREKACGDGLTPSSIAQLERLGIALPDRLPLRGTFVSGPSERAFRADWPGGLPNGTTMRRSAFDATLVAAAVAAGARFESRTAVDGCAGGRIALRGATSREPARFDAVVLADGATGALGTACGFGPHALRLAAFRGYAPAHADLTDDYQVHYARPLLPGYAWIFPVAPRYANVGAVLAASGDVRAALRAWLTTSAFARRWLGKTVTLEQARGGIIPVGRGTRYADRVFAIGDAAGVADPLSAEGVSQAMGSAVLAAEALLACGGDVERAGASYESRVRRYDANNREALRMRWLFARCADPLVALARLRPALARHVVSTGYFPKDDAAWFAGSFRALIRG